MGNFHSSKQHCIEEEVHSDHGPSASPADELTPLPFNPRPSTSETRRRSVVDQYFSQVSPLEHNRRRSTFSTNHFTPAGRLSCDLSSVETCTLIKQSWAAVLREYPNKSKIGEEIFKLIFAECPELKVVFHIKLDQSIEDLQEQHPFRRHVTVFAHFIDLVARNVDDIEREITPALVTYGRRHYSKHRVGFTSSYTSAFTRSVINFIRNALDDDFSTELAVAWDKLMRFVVQKMKYGYDQEAAHKGRRFSSIFS